MWNYSFLHFFLFSLEILSHQSSPLLSTFQYIPRQSYPFLWLWLQYNFMPSNLYHHPWTVYLKKPLTLYINRMYNLCTFSYPNLIILVLPSLNKRNSHTHWFAKVKTINICFACLLSSIPGIQSVSKFSRLYHLNTSKSNLHLPFILSGS